MAFRTHQGNDSRPRSSDMRHRGDDSPSDGRKHSRQIHPGKQQFRGRKRRHGAPLQRFLPWLTGNTTMGPLGAPRSRRKSSKKSGETRKASGKPPMGPRMPYWAHAARPPGGVSCHPASKTAQPPLPAKKSLLTLRAFNRYPPRRVKSVKHSVLLPEGNRERNQPPFANPSSNTPPKHRFDVALRLFH